MYFFRWLTIFRIGTKKDDDKKDRYPGVFFHSKAGIYVRNHLSGKKDFGGKMVYAGEKLKKRSLSEDAGTLVKVSQLMDGDKLMFKVTPYPTLHLTVKEKENLVQKRFSRILLGSVRFYLKEPRKIPNNPKNIQFGLWQKYEDYYYWEEINSISSSYIIQNFGLLMK